MAANTAKTVAQNTVTVELTAMDVVIMKEALAMFATKRDELAVSQSRRGNMKMKVANKRSSDRAAALRRNLPDTIGNSLEYAFFSTPTSWGGVKP
jgi:hypothetical protein